MSIWCFGDCHGNFKALQQIFERAPIVKGDTIISLGDVCDGWSEVYECVGLLISMEKDYKMINLKGNHDDWFENWIDYGLHPTSWLQGGIGTLKSYCKNLDKEYIPKNSGYTTNLLSSDIPQSHRNFFKNQKLYFLDHNNRFYVHGGFDRRQYIDYLTATSAHDFYWNRDLWNQALSCADGVKLKTNDDFNEIFIGHTATDSWTETVEIECFAKETGESLGMRKMTRPIITPMNSGGVYNLDQGAGWIGKLTIMNVESKEYFQSDLAKELYPNEIGRG